MTSWKDLTNEQRKSLVYEYFDDADITRIADVVAEEGKYSLSLDDVGEWFDIQDEEFKKELLGQNDTC